MTARDPNLAKGGPIARTAAMLCGEHLFRIYLEKVHRLPARTKQQTREAVYGICGGETPLTSLAYLDHDTAAAARFYDLKAHFAAWSKPT